MESNNTQRKIIYPHIFYFGLESNPLKKSQQSRHCENPRFSGARVLVGGDSSRLLFWREKGFVLKTDFESNQSRQFVLLNKQKFV